MQAIALDHGRLAIIQPLLVTTVVFALPLGYFLTAQEVGLRHIVGAAVVVLGLAMYAIFGDPAGGNENAPNDEWAIALGIVGVVCAILYVAAARATPCARPRITASSPGSCSASPPVSSSQPWKLLHDGGVDAAPSHWEPYGMAITGVVAFALQQVSLSAGYLADVRRHGLSCNPIVPSSSGVYLRRAAESTGVARRRGGVRVGARDARGGRDLDRPREERRGRSASRRSRLAVVNRRCRYGAAPQPAERRSRSRSESRDV